MDDRTSNPENRPDRLGAATLGVHGDPKPGRPGEPVVPPIVQSATFYGGGAGERVEDLRYTRYGNNPNQIELARKMAALEGAEASLAVGSGQAAVALTVLALVEAGERIVASPYLYGATRALFDRELPRRGITVGYFDPFDPETLSAAIDPATRLVYFEAPTNPTLRVCDVPTLARIAAEHGVPSAIDATFASPVNLRPVEHGVTLSIHSATKYLGGHSDLIAGVVSGPEELVYRITGMLKLYGPAIDPHNAWLVDRGLRTLVARVKTQNESALELARWFEGQDGIDRVVHPGLPSHPDHERASGLLDGFGGMLSIVLGGGGAAADAFGSALRIAKQAPSLGGVETLVSQPKNTSHVALSPEERAELGMPDGFVRISVGVESFDDLRDDFARALEVASTA